MKNLLYIFSFIFSAALLLSCEPNRAENGDLLFGVLPPEYDSVAAVKYLSKVNATWDGMTQNVSYTYNDNKLVNVVSDGQHTGEYTLIYDGNKVSQISIKQNVLGQAATALLTMHYDNNILASAEGEVTAGPGLLLYKTKTEFTYADGKPTRILTVHSTENPDHLGTFEPYMKMESIISYDDANVSQWQLTKDMLLDPTAVTESKVARFGLYDDKKNPFAVLPLAYKLLSPHFGPETGAPLGLSPNNFTELQTEGKTAHITYQYQDDYPVEGTGSKGNATFTYIN